MYTYLFQKQVFAGSCPATLTMKHVGKHSCYSTGCRKPQCKKAHSIYTIEQKRKRISEDWKPPVDVRLVQAYMRILKRRYNIGVVALAQKTGISTNNLCKIKNGKVKWVRGDTATKIFEVEDYYYIHCTALRKHLKWLSSRGIGSARISMVTGIPVATIDQIRNGSTTFTYRGNSQKLLAVGLHMFKDWRHEGTGPGIGVVSDYLFRKRVS